MAAGTSASFCFLIVCFLVYTCTAQTIKKAELRQDVTLPCKVPNNINNIKAVKWSRPELKPKYVLLYRDGHLDPHNQHPSYKNRVDLQDKEMKDGNVSLILKNVMMEDRGTYECRVISNGMKKPISIIILEVHLSGDQDRIIGDAGDKDGGNMVGVIGGHLGVVGVILLHFLVSVVFF